MQHVQEPKQYMRYINLSFSYNIVAKTFDNTHKHRLHK